jgi:hypothetical protein
MRALWISLIVLATACEHSDRTPDPDDLAPGKPRVNPMVGTDDTCNPQTPKLCLGNDVVECDADGHLGRRLRACHHGCTDGKCEQTCEDDNTKLIYVVSTSNDFLSFDPRKLPGNPFHLIGKLHCGHNQMSPFSMSVDRNGIAWVVYGDGEMFKVNITTAKCDATSYIPGSSGSSTFGMGFSTDKSGGDTEKLFIAANDQATDRMNDLSSIDTAHDLKPHHVGTLTATVDENPELTGTSEARLFGFYPSFVSPSFVQEINRSNGAPIGKKWFLGSDPLGDVSAYAFAQWGGVFYIFATISDGFEDNSTVRTIDRTTGKYRTIMSHLNWRISGAGVSTCAPERDASNLQTPQGP